MLVLLSCSHAPLLAARADVRTPDHPHARTLRSMRSSTFVMTSSSSGATVPTCGCVAAMCTHRSLLTSSPSAGVTATTTKDTPAGEVRSGRLSTSAHAVAKKNAMDDNGGLLVGRGDFRHGFKEQLLSGGKRDCIADSCAMVLGAKQCDVRAFFGIDHVRARASSSSAHLTDLTT